MRVVGLTGGIATGKSTVAEVLREHFGVPVVDADQVAREVVEPGEPALNDIVERFGPGVLVEDGSLDRAALREVVMHDAEARQALEGITHPAIYRTIASRLAALAREGHPIAVVEAALLVETGTGRQYDALVVVSCGPEEQVRRVVRRDGVDEVGARAVLAAQLPLADKERVADVVIRTDAPIEQLSAKVAVAWAQLGSAW